jgi:hypothetical protein
VIPIARLTDADRKWVVTAEHGGTGGRPLEGGMVLEEPDIEIGAGVSSKGNPTSEVSVRSLTVSQLSVDVSHQRPGEAVAEDLAGGASEASVADEVASTMNVIIDKIVSRFTSPVTFHRDLSQRWPFRLPFQDSVFS